MNPPVFQEQPFIVKSVETYVLRSVRRSAKLNEGQHSIVLGLRPIIRSY